MEGYPGPSARTRREAAPNLTFRRGLASRRGRTGVGLSASAAGHMSASGSRQARRLVPTAHLSDRGVVRVSGADARPFLDGLVTCDLDKVGPDRPRFGALLTPQGKLLFDFLLFEAPQDAGGGFYLDCLRFMAPDLAKRLGFYKLQGEGRGRGPLRNPRRRRRLGRRTKAGRRDRPRRRRPAPQGARLARDRRGRGCGGSRLSRGGRGRVARSATG